MSITSAVISIVAVAALSWGSAVAQERKPARAAISDLAWLAGNWGGDGKPVVVEERWTPAAGGAMLGVARTIKNDRMVAFEFLRIVERDGGLVYIAQPNGRPPTEFALTSLAGQTATFENPAHDFPKMIRYSLKPDGTLEARVSDGGSRGESLRFARMR
jgi:Domain of unknown function (DUF6265)